MAEENAGDNQTSFEAALSELQQIVSDLEDGKLGLEPSLARFEQGISLLRNCHRILEQAEQKIELLVRLEPDGAEVSTPFDGSATFEAESAQKKTGRRKSTKATGSAAVRDLPAAPAEQQPDAASDESGPSLF